MNRILVPTDFSPTSVNALFYAIQLFKGVEVAITVLYTYDASSSAFHVKSIDHILEEDAQQEMNALVDKVLSKEPGVALNTKILKGNPVSTISKWSNKGAFDFIVMGTKGASGLKEVFVGSVAGGVIAKSMIPVLVVPDSYQYEPLQKIVFAVSNEPISDTTIIEPLRKIAEITDGNIQLLHITDDQESDIKEVLNSLGDLNTSVAYIPGSQNVNESLSKYLKEEEAGLLCLVRRKEDLFSRIFKGSVTLKQTFNSKLPLLVLHDYSL